MGGEVKRDAKVQWISESIVMGIQINTKRTDQSDG